MKPKLQLQNKMVFISVHAGMMSGCGRTLADLNM